MEMRMFMRRLINIKSKLYQEVIWENCCIKAKSFSAPPPVPQSVVPQRTAPVAKEAFTHRQDSSEDRSKFSDQLTLKYTCFSEYEGNRYSDEPPLEVMGENEDLDWELIYTTNAIRQMSRINKWSESILNNDRISKVNKNPNL